MSGNYTASTSLNPLGAMGLDYSGIYSSYPTALGGYGSMYGMSGMNGMMGLTGMTGAYGGMMGMYNPAFMQSMMQAQQNMEKAQVDHSQVMHAALTQAEVNSLSAHNRAIFQKITADGEVQRGIRNLVDLVRKGDSDGICAEYEKIRSNIYTKFAHELAQDKTGDIKLNVDRYIEMMYNQIVSQQGGQPADLRYDMKKYGETAFMNGFNRTFLGNKGHNDRYTEEAIAYIDGTRINDKGSKDRAQKWGGWAARAVEGTGAYIAGFFGGLASLGISKLFVSTIPGCSNIAGRSWGGIGTWGKIGALGVLGADVLWQMTRD